MRARSCACSCDCASACPFVSMRMPVRVCMCVRVSEAEVSWLFHQTLVSTPVWECAGIRSCDNRRVLLCNAVQGASGYAQSPQGRRRLAKPVSTRTPCRFSSDCSASTAPATPKPHPARQPKSRPLEGRSSRCAQPLEHPSPALPRPSPD